MPILGLGMPIVVPIFHFGLGIQPVVINSIPTHSWNRLDSDRTDMTMISVVSIRGCMRKGQNEINLTKFFRENDFTEKLWLKFIGQVFYLE